MISAAEALDRIEQAGRGLRRDEDRLGAIIEGSAKEIARLRQEQAELFKALARLRLDDLRQDRVIGRLDEAERRALAELQKQQAELEALATQRETLAAEIEQARQQRMADSDAVSEAARAVAQLTEATSQRLADELGWQQQSARLAGAEDRAHAAEEKARQSEADRDEKSRPYLDDPLFVYLWKRGYGTSAYRSGPITRIGDAFVAKVVNFEPARRNYFTLTEIPKRLRQHADRLRVEADEEEDRLAALERKALEADGILEREAALAQAEKALDATDNRIARLEEEMAAADRRRESLLNGEGEGGIATALRELAEAIAREDLRELMREALQSPSPDDDRIIRRLQEIEARIRDKEREAEDARRAAIDLARKRAELERSRDQFRQSGYDRGGGGFANDKLIGDILGGIIGGVLSSRELRDALRSGYRGGNARSAPTSRPGGRTFGRSGRSGGGGFRTGGRF